MNYPDDDMSSVAYASGSEIPGFRKAIMFELIDEPLRPPDAPSPPPADGPVPPTATVLAAEILLVLLLHILLPSMMFVVVMGIQ